MDTVPPYRQHRFQDRTRRQERAEMLLNGDHLLDQLKFSADGRWIAYNSDESGRAEVYVARFPKMDDVRQVSHDCGCQPLWRKDGKELFDLDPDGKLFSVDFADGAAAVLFRPELALARFVVGPAVFGCDAQQNLLR
jgi:hypothetical protein